MPEQFLHLPVADRKDILQTAAAQLGQQATVLEKDVWVCWALQTLFSMPDAHPMAFKGGTSLSKIYGALKRFSEDVDVTLDYRAFDDDFDPFAAGVSNNAVKKFSKRLKAYVLQYTNDIVAPCINAQLKALPRQDEYGIEVSDDGEKIRVRYPSAIEGSDEYLQSSILIELGGRNVIDAGHASGTAAINNRALFENVVQHKQVFFNATYANYDACLTNALRLIPDDKAIAELRTDYEKMLGAGMVYGDPPTFDEIIADIRELERAVNTW